MKINEIFNCAMDTQHFLVSGSHYEMITPLSLGTILPHVRLFQYYCFPCAVQLMKFLTSFF